jgi:hypothetical protein
MMRLKRCKLRSGGRDHEIKVQRSETRSKEARDEEKKTGDIIGRKELCVFSSGGGGRK